MMYMEEKLAETSASDPFTVFIIDGDKFNLINDTYGHIEGDSAIVCIARAVGQVAHKYDLFCARYGGDEFLMFKSGKCPFDPNCMVNEINENLKQICIEHQKTYTLSVSIGFYTSYGSNEAVDTVIKKADEKLYETKAKRTCPPMDV